MSPIAAHHMPTDNVARTLNSPRPESMTHEFGLGCRADIVRSLRLRSRLRTKPLPARLRKGSTESETGNKHKREGAYHPSPGDMNNSINEATAQAENAQHPHTIKLCHRHCCKPPVPESGLWPRERESGHALRKVASRFSDPTDDLGSTEVIRCIQ
jgi:hypothetical protein